MCVEFGLNDKACFVCEMKKENKIKACTDSGGYKCWEGFRFTVPILYVFGRLKAEEEKERKRGTERRVIEK